MKKISKFLPMAEMQAEFEQYNNLTTDAERLEFQENRAQRLESLSDSDRESYVHASVAGLNATVEAAEELILTTKLGEIAKAVSLSYIAKTYFGKSRAWLISGLTGIQ